MAINTVLDKPRNTANQKKANQAKLREIKQVQHLLRKVILVGSYSPLAGLDMQERLLSDNKVSPPETFLMNPQGQKINLIKSHAKTLFTLRFEWTIFTAILCRKPSGEVFFMHATEEELSEIALTDLNKWLADTLDSKWEKINPMYRLCRIWLARPCSHEFKYRQFVAPLYYNKLLQRHFTEYELTHPEHEVVAYHTQHAKDLNEFISALLCYDELLKDYHRKGQSVDMGTVDKHALLTGND